MVFVAFVFISSAKLDAPANWAQLFGLFNPIRTSTGKWWRRPIDALVKPLNVTVCLADWLNGPLISQQLFN